MRKYIDIIAAPEALQEANRFTHLAAAAALAGTMGYHIGKANQDPAPELPQIIITTDNSPLDDSVENDSANETTKLLALTMWGEARSDGVDAMRAVGHVVINRIRSSRAFGKNVKEVVWKRKSFSCWNQGDPNRDAMKKIASLPEKHPSKQRWHQAVKLAKNIVSGKDGTDPTHGALFYHTKGMGKPYWVSDDMKPVAVVGNHLFYDTDAKAKTLS